MIENKRFTNIEHDYENAWIKCNDDEDFMIYAIYKELDESLPSLEDLLNGLNDEKETLFDAVKKADELINRFGSEELKHEWKKEVTMKYG